ncbi:sulfatase-like hydrolase/transferase [Pseudoalteromonas sp. B137]
MLKISINEESAIYILLISSSLIILIYIYGINQLSTTKKRLSLFALLISLLILFEAQYFKNHLTIQESDKTNVIIIGVDSLRPDYISEPLTPYIYNWKKEAIEIPNTLTPIARTFPSWGGILTGEHPITNNIRFNLSENTKYNQHSFIGYTLLENGYKTIFSQDERKFSNISEGEGFTTVIGPPASAAEFFLSNLSQLPQLALATQIPFVDLLFPYIKSNRGAYKAYIPSNFIDKISNNLEGYKDKPLFFVNHFTLPHFPFNFNRPVFLPNEKLDPLSPYKYMYKGMLKTADKQVKLLIENLKVRGLLRNAIVIILSDHGESFGDESDGPTPKYDVASFETNSAGHGTNVLSQAQFKVFLSVKLYGNAEQCTSLFTPVKGKYNSLLDITPSILECLSIKDSKLSDGQAFSTPDTDRALILESSINPIVLSKNRIDKIQTLANGIKFYTINKEGKVIVKPSIYNAAIAAKQRSIIYKKFSLAIYPDIKDDLIFVELETNEWQPASMYKDRELVDEMFHILCRKYEKDINKGLIEQCNNPNKYLESIYEKWER